MYLYWRIQQELNEMGNELVFHDPGFIRAFEKWVRKNTGGLALAHGLCVDDILKKSVNPN